MATVLIVMLLAGCGTNSNGNANAGAEAATTNTSEAADDAATNTPAAATKLTDINLIEVWYVKGEDGGYFAALQQNYYKESGREHDDYARRRPANYRDDFGRFGEFGIS